MPRELILYNPVGDAPFDAKSVRAALEAAGKADLHVRINSSGGNVFEALSIHDMLARHVGQVLVHVDGFALSAASVVAMAGRSIEVSANAWMMLHDPVLTMAGTAADLANAAEMVGKARDQLVGIYAGRTGLARERVAELMAAETWLTAAEAVVLKFADSIAPAKRLAASVDLSTFKNIPLHLKGKAMSEPTTIADLRAACPGAPADFLLKQLEAGADAATAKAAWLDQRERELAARERAAATTRTPGVDALGSGQGRRSASAAGDEAEQFSTLVAEKVAGGMDRRAAVFAIARAHKDLHHAFVASANSSSPTVRRLIDDRFAE